MTPGRAREVVNLATGATLLGLAVARVGGARPVPGPDRLLLAGGYPAPGSAPPRPTPRVGA